MASDNIEGNAAACCAARQMRAMVEVFMLCFGMCSGIAKEGEGAQRCKRKGWKDLIYEFGVPSVGPRGQILCHGKGRDMSLMTSEAS